MSNDKSVGTEPKVEGTASAVAIAKPVAPKIEDIGKKLRSVLQGGTANFRQTRITVNVLGDNQVELVEWPKSGDPISHGVYES